MANRTWASLFGAIMVLLAWPVSGHAADCTATQRAAADRQLWLNERDRNLATEMVFPWGAPVSGDAEGQRRLVQRDYVIEYDDDLQGPVWSANVLGLETLRGGRIDCFRQDPRIPGAVASRPADYNEPIFDQGHMVPNADMTFSDIAIMNTFIMSNMSPQFCQFNRGIWQIFETFVRHWARGDDTPLYILNGAVFDWDGDGARDSDHESVRMRSRSGRTNVAVPSAYFKILAREASDGRLHTLTILLPHDQVDVDGQFAVDYLRGHITTIDVVERLTNTNFFPEGGPLNEHEELWDISEASFRSLVAAPCRRTAGAFVVEGTPRTFALP